MVVWVQICWQLDGLHMPIESSANKLAHAEYVVEHFNLPDGLWNDDGNLSQRHNNCISCGVWIWIEL